MSSYNTLHTLWLNQRQRQLEQQRQQTLEDQRMQYQRESDTRQQLKEARDFKFQQEQAEFDRKARLVELYSKNLAAQGKEVPKFADLPQGMREYSMLGAEAGRADLARERAIGERQTEVAKQTYGLKSTLEAEKATQRQELAKQKAAQRAQELFLRNDLTKEQKLQLFDFDLIKMDIEHDMDMALLRERLAGQENVARIRAAGETDAARITSGLKPQDVTEYRANFDRAGKILSLPTTDRRKMRAITRELGEQGLKSLKLLQQEWQRLAVTATSMPPEERNTQWDKFAKTIPGYDRILQVLNAPTPEEVAPSAPAPAPSAGPSAGPSKKEQLLQMLESLGG